MRNLYDYGYGTRTSANSPGDVDELTPERIGRLRRWRRRLAWQRRVMMVAARTALPGALLLALAAVMSVPLPAKAATLGTGWSTHLSATGSAMSTAGDTATITWRARATARISFSGRLLPGARRAIVTMALQQVGRGGVTTVGTLTSRADRAFNTPPTTLSALFAEMGVTPHPGVRYALTIAAGGATLTRATVTLTR